MPNPGQGFREGQVAIVNALCLGKGRADKQGGSSWMSPEMKPYPRS